MTQQLSIEKRVEMVPVDPGCYLWKDESGRVLYVGKAKNLHSRMKQYVQQTDDREMIPRLMKAAKDFEYIVVGSEVEALILETNLIHEYQPPFNVMLKDDKSYPYIALTMSDVFPAIKLTREKRKKGTLYFGPFTDIGAAREMVDIVRRVTPLCSSGCAEWKALKRKIDRGQVEHELIEMEMSEKGKPCFDYHVGKGPGVCVGEISRADYAEHVNIAKAFLAGKRSGYFQQITEKMYDAAADLDFEGAARYKRQLDAMGALSNKQRIVFSSPVNVDSFGFYREETIAGAYILVVREGRPIRNLEYVLDKGKDVSESDVIESFITKYYSLTDDLPDEINIPSQVENKAVLEEWLCKKRSRKVKIVIPIRGEKKSFNDTANLNAKHALMRFKVRTRYDDARTNEALLQLESALGLEKAPMRIECFDISTIHGTHSVASMVVCTNGKMDHDAYRRFKMRTVTETGESDDFAMMSETLGRRYAPERMKDARFGSKPDLLIVDGGRPQLNAAIKQLEGLGLDIPLCGLAKADEELFVPWSETPIVLPTGSASLYLVKQIRDESHRVAITYHRELRGKAMTVSILDEVEGVGSKRKRALMKKFGSIKKIREASVEELSSVSGINENIAQDIYDTLRVWRPDDIKSGDEAGSEDL